MARSRTEQKTTGADIILHVMLLLAVVFIYLVFQVSQFTEVGDVNALDYAQVARHVYRGEGFTTSFIKPLSLVHNQSIESHPELTYPPLHILWTSGMMRVLGPNDKAVSHASGLAFILGIIAVYLLAWRLFDRRAAILAAVLYATNITYLSYAISGLETSLLGLLVTVLLLFLYQASTDTRREGLWVVFAGIIMGLLYLTKYIWGLALIPTLIFLWLLRRERRATRPIVFAVLALVVATPWFIRNYNITGNPFFTLRCVEALEQTKQYPGNSLYRTFNDTDLSFIRFAAGNPRAIALKVRDGMLTFYRTITMLAGPYVTPLFLVAIVVGLGDERFERWRLLLYAFIAIIAIGLSFLIAAPRLIFPAGPAALVIAVGYFWRLIDARIEPLDLMKQPRVRNLALGVLLALHLIPLITAIAPGSPAAREGVDAVRSAAVQLNDITSGVVVTDVPWMVAWVADRDALWLPQNPTELRKCEQAVGRFQWLLLSPMLPRTAPQERMEKWAEVWARGLRADTEYEEFVVHARLSTGRWILLKRKPVTAEAEVPSSQ